MEVGSPEWIEASLARLDELETERDEHEEALESITEPAALRQHTEALARLDEEIKSLYAQLESVAEDDDEEDEDDAPRATQGDEEHSAPHVAAEEAPAPAEAPAEEAPAPAAAAAAAASPFASPVSEPVSSPTDNPFGSPSPAPSAFDAPPTSFSDDDLKPKGGSAKWVFLALVGLGVAGGGGYFAWTNMQAKKAKEAKKAPTDQPAQVIKAADIPDDTEAPPTAPSGEATISPNAMPSNGKKKKKKDDEEEAPKPLELKTGEGPL